MIVCPFKDLKRYTASIPGLEEAAAVMATLMAVTRPVPSQRVIRSLCRLETTVPAEMIVEISPA